MLKIHFITPIKSILYSVCSVVIKMCVHIEARAHTPDCQLERVLFWSETNCPDSWQRRLQLPGTSGQPLAGEKYDFQYTRHEVTS